MSLCGRKREYSNPAGTKAVRPEAVEGSYSARRMLRQAQHEQTLETSDRRVSRQKQDLVLLDPRLRGGDELSLCDCIERALTIER